MKSVDFFHFSELRAFWKGLIENNWFSIFDLACVVFGIVIIELERQPTPLPIGIMFLPWALRLSTGRFLFHRTRYDVSFLIFASTAILGTWSAYNPNDAWLKFWLLIGGILLFFSLAGQKKENLWLISGLLGLLGAAVAVYFLLTNDWSQFPAKIVVINQIGLWWMKIRPAVVGNEIYHNSVAGLIVYTLPFILALGINAWQENKKLVAIWSLITGILALIGFLLTTSRGAALAFFVGILVWLIKAGIFHRLRILKNSWIIRFGPYLIIMVVLIAGYVLLVLAGTESLVNNDLLFSNPGSRLELYKNSLQLIGDLPFTGSGLSTFPGIYSSYILGIPSYFYLSSHNLYLNVALEQGVLGLVVLCAIYFGSIGSVLVSKDHANSLLVGASLTSLVIILLHNLVDNIISDSVFVPIIFLIPGVTYAINRLSSPYQGFNHKMAEIRSFLDVKDKRYLLIGSAALIFVIISSLVYNHRLSFLASWYADLGSVSMARVELVDFPTNQWDEGQHLADLILAEEYFLRAIQFDPNNRTANHRLGLIAMMRRDYPTAIVYLEKSYQANPGHRGIWKSLGYAYVWSGQFDAALPFLQKIPEAMQELDTYRWWWTTHDRQDLSINAELMFQKLAATDILTGR